MPTAILALGVLLPAFLLGLIFGGPYIQLLRRLRIGANIRREGPSRDFAKQGIPTMGGALFIIVVAVLWVFVLVLLPEGQRDVFVPQTIVPIGALVGVGLLGAIDDWVNVTYGFGIRGRHKLVWQVIVGLAAAVYIRNHFDVTGALAIGATLAACALTTGFVLLLPVAGVIFVAETVSVILQVGSFKLRGKRIFRMSPLHNHFELIGWPEEKVTIRFWLIAALAGIVAAILAFATPIE